MKGKQGAIRSTSTLTAVERQSDSRDYCTVCAGERQDSRKSVYEHSYPDRRHKSCVQAPLLQFNAPLPPSFPSPALLKKLLDSSMKAEEDKVLLLENRASHAERLPSVLRSVLFNIESGVSSQTRAAR